MGGSSVVSILANLSPLLFIAASVVLFVKTRSPWILVAAILEVIMLLFRAAMYFNVTQFVGNEIFMGAWQLIGLLTGVCFLGFAATWQPDDNRRMP